MKNLVRNSVFIIIGGIVTAGLLSWVSNGFGSFEGVWSFSLLVLIGIFASILVWNWLNTEELPALAVWVFIGAVLLRLLAGSFWYILLPEYGYDNPVNNAGYVMSDAYERDVVAWRLGTSDRPLLDAFTSHQAVDQYGGLLFLSALIYRVLGGEQHYHLMIIVMTAFASGLAVWFTWAFARRLWDRRIAAYAAVGVALYPEAILLGSSQMREAITITLTAAALYGLARFLKDREMAGLFWIGSALILSLPLSYLFTATLIAALALFAIGYGQMRMLRDWRFWVGILVMGAVVLGVITIFGERLYPGIDSRNPLLILKEWIAAAGRWQVYFSERGSGWIQKVFESTPEWTHMLILLGYGIARPFLPAAILDRSNDLWWAIAIWRAVGWTLLLPFLVYAPLRALQRQKGRRMAVVISAIVWLIILLASYRGGGDLWDNPRYRLSFLSLQAVLAAWAWTGMRDKPDPWFRRVVILVVSMIAWFIPWYARRYLPFPWYVVDVFRTLGLGIISGAILMILDWAWTNFLGSRKEGSPPVESGPG